MLICRYKTTKGSQYGVVNGRDVFALRDDLFGDSLQAREHIGVIDDVQLLVPVAPSKIVCVGRNYAAHAQELGNEVPTEPLLFFKPPSSLIPHQDPILLLNQMGKVDHEAELAVIIGKQAKNVTASNALDYVVGYTCGNDISDRDFQKKDGQWTRAKGFDTFCPLGPWINTDLDPSNIAITCMVNGDKRQEGHTSQLVFNIPTLIAHISAIMTLMPGDVILTGTPAGVGPIHDGDIVEVVVEGIGSLTNPVRKLN